MPFRRVEDYQDEIFELCRTGWKPGASTGWPNLDRHYTVGEAQFTVVTGMPMHGKSEFMAAMLVNLAKLHDWKIAVVSPEHSPTHRLICRMLEKEMRQPLIQLSDVPKAKPERIVESIQWMNEHFFFFEAEDDEPPLMDYVWSGVDFLERRFKIKVNGLLLDPYNEFDHSRTQLDARLSETEYINRYLSDLRRATRRRKIHLWLVAHPTKLQKRQDGTYPKASLYDINGSAAFRNKCDVGISVYRNELEGGDNYTSVDVQKVKFKEIGSPGEVEFTHDLITGTYKPRIPEIE